MVAVGRWTRYVVVAAAAVVVAVSVVAALSRAVSPDDAQAAPDAAVEPPSVVTPAASPSATSEAMPGPAVAVPTGDPAHRFLSVDGGGVVWRGIAGSCADGVAPRLVRSADGARWSEVLPAGAAQLLSLRPGDGALQAHVVIAAAGTCAAAGRSTAPDGRSWQDAPDLVAAWDGTAPSGGAPEGALAHTTAGDTTYVAYRADECAGVAFAQAVPDQPLGAAWTACDPGMDPSEPIAVDYSDGRLHVWSGSIVTAVPVL
jgi:hypothetical protein